MVACVPSGAGLWLLAGLAVFPVVVLLSPLWALAAVIADYRRARRRSAGAWARRISLASLDRAVGPYRNARRTALVPANPPVAIAVLAAIALFAAYFSPALVPGVLALRVDPNVGLLAAPPVVVLALRMASFGRALLSRNAGNGDAPGLGIAVALCFVALASVMTATLIGAT